MTDSKDMALTVYRALEDKKGEDIAIIDISTVSCIADYFVIASATNGNQVQAMIDNVEEAMGRKGYECTSREGYQAAQWVLLDYKDVVVHVFSQEDRRFYDIERIWRDGKFLSANDLMA